jgi:hypothetical protein
MCIAKLVSLVSITMSLFRQELFVAFRVLSSKFILMYGVQLI